MGNCTSSSVDDCAKNGTSGSIVGNDECSAACQIPAFLFPRSKHAFLNLGLVSLSCILGPFVLWYVIKAIHNTGLSKVRARPRSKDQVYVRSWHGWVDAKKHIRRHARGREWRRWVREAGRDTDIGDMSWIFWDPDGSRKNLHQQKNDTGGFKMISKWLKNTKQKRRASGRTGRTRRLRDIEQGRSPSGSSSGQPSPPVSNPTRSSLFGRNARRKASSCLGLDPCCATPSTSMVFSQPTSIPLTDLRDADDKSQLDGTGDGRSRAPSIPPLRPETFYSFQEEWLESTDTVMCFRPSATGSQVFQAGSQETDRAIHEQLIQPRVSSCRYPDIRDRAKSLPLLVVMRDRSSSRSRRNLMTGRLSSAPASVERPGESNKHANGPHYKHPVDTSWEDIDDYEAEASIDDAMSDYLTDDRTASFNLTAIPDSNYLNSDGIVDISTSNLSDCDDINPSSLSLSRTPSTPKSIRSYATSFLVSASSNNPNKHAFNTAESPTSAIKGPDEVKIRSPSPTITVAKRSRRLENRTFELCSSPISFKDLISGGCSQQQAPLESRSTSSEGAQNREEHEDEPSIVATKAVRGRACTPQPPPPPHKLQSKPSHIEPLRPNVTSPEREQRSSGFGFSVVYRDAGPENGISKGERSDRGKGYHGIELEEGGAPDRSCGDEYGCRRTKMADGSEICSTHGAEGWRWEGGVWVRVAVC